MAFCILPKRVFRGDICRKNTRNGERFTIIFGNGGESTTLCEPHCGSKKVATNTPLPERLIRKVSKQPPWQESVVLMRVKKTMVANVIFWLYFGIVDISSSHGGKRPVAATERGFY